MEKPTPTDLPAADTERASFAMESKAYDLKELEHKQTRDGGPPVSAFRSHTRAQLVRKFWRLYGTGIMVASGAMYAGYGNSVVGSIVANEGFINHFATVADRETGARVLDANHVALWTAITFASQILIQIISPILADRWGRKFNMWVLTFFLTLSIVLEIVAQEYLVLMASRIASGFASGLLGTSIMVYMSEMAMPQFRGALLSSFSLFFSLGQVFLAIGLKILNDTEPLKFRNIFYSEFVFFGIWLIPMIYIPESPAWYAAKGRHDEGMKALRRLVGTVEGYDLSHEYSVLRYEVEESIIQSKNSSENNWRALFTRTNFKRSIISTLPLTFQNFVGVPLIFGFTTYFFSLANVDDPFLGSLIIQLILVVGIIVSFYLLDRVGRRTLVLAGGAAMGALTTMIGGLGFLTPSNASGIALVALCAVWAFIYAISLAPIGWVSLVEISTPHLRAKTAAVGSVIQSCSGVLLSYTVPLMLSNQGANWGQKIGLFFGGITFVYLIPCILLFPETKGRTYLELDELFQRGVPAWRFASTKTTASAQPDAATTTARV